MPPEPRFVPRFAAEPPQDALPYGRWEERLREEFLAAALGLDDAPEDIGRPEGIAWYPDRTWHGQKFSSEQAHFVCPWHGYEYDIRTGECVGNRKLRLKSFEVLRRGDELYVLAG